MVDASDLNPVANLELGSIGMVLLIFFVSLLILGMIGLGIYVWIQKKQLKYSIPLQKKIGHTVQKIDTFKAKEVKIGMAGDKLWYVPKAKKWISPPTIQSAPNEYTHFEREDGEWINVGYPDVDEKMKEMGVKYVHQDMRSQRISIGNILEDRFKDKKSWWEKYGHLVTHVIFYFVVCLALVVIFYQWGDIVDKTSALVDKIDVLQNGKCPAQQGVVPVANAVLLFLIKPFKRKNNE